MSDPSAATAAWDAQQAHDLYTIRRWGAKNSDTNDAGHVVPQAVLDAGAAVDLTATSTCARERSCCKQRYRRLSASPIPRPKLEAAGSPR